MTSITNTNQSYLPQKSVQSTVTSSVKKFEGTAGSAATVTAAVCMVVNIFPAASPDQIKAMLLKTADKTKTEENVLNTNNLLKLAKYLNDNNKTISPEDIGKLDLSKIK